tara:strand:+ start:382 stop:1017 length:636 start_codon:yes stop_codon:yes gene_type:complete
MIGMNVYEGAAIGAVQVAVGHPFDTLKTLIQNGQSWRNLSLHSFYRGWTWPIALNVAFNATAFPLYDWAHHRYKNPYLAGCLAGLAVSPVEFGFGMGKIRRQTLTNVPLHSRGFTMASVRTTAAMTVYFGIYEDLRPHLPAFYAGALAGLANWTLTYPVDVISTRQIAANITIREAIQMGHLFRGYVPCAVRALLVNGASFTLYDWFKDNN